MKLRLIIADGYLMFDGDNQTDEELAADPELTAWVEQHGTGDLIAGIHRLELDVDVDWPADRTGPPLFRIREGGPS